MNKKFKKLISIVFLTNIFTQQNLYSKELIKNQKITGEYKTIKDRIKENPGELRKYLKYIVPAGVLAAIPIGLELKFLYDIFSSSNKTTVENNITEQDIIKEFENYINYIKTNINITYNQLHISDLEKNLMSLLANFNKNTQDINTIVTEIQEKITKSENYTKRFEVFVTYAPENIKPIISELYKKNNINLINLEIEKKENTIEETVISETQEKITELKENIKEKKLEKKLEQEISQPETKLDTKENLTEPSPTAPHNLSGIMPPPPPPPALGKPPVMPGALPGLPPPPPSTGFAGGIQLSPFQKALADISAEFLRNTPEQEIINKCKKYTHEFFGSEKYLNMQYILDNYPERLEKLLYDIQKKRKQYTFSDQDLTVFWPMLCATGFVHNYKSLQASIVQLRNLNDDPDYVYDKLLVDLSKSLTSDAAKNYVENQTTDISKIEKEIFTKLDTALTSGLNRVYKTPKNKTDNQTETKKTDKIQIEWYEKTNKYSWVKNIFSKKSENLTDCNSKLEQFLNNIKIKLDNMTILTNFKNSYENLKVRVKKENNARLYTSIEQNLKKIKDKLSIYEKDKILQDIVPKQAKILPGFKNIPKDLSGKLSFLVKDFGLSKKEIKRILNSEIEKSEEIIDPEIYKLN